MSEDKKDHPLNIILLGISGSGKGTQAKMLCEKYNLEYIGTGDMLRKFAKEENAAARKLKEELDIGHLVPTWVPFYLWMDRLVNVPEEKGVLFDGSPRKIGEAELLSDVLFWYGRKNIKAILIDVPEEEIMQRLLNRRTCAKCGKSAYVAPEEKSTVCGHCGGEMKIRPEDNPDAIKKRIEWFNHEVQEVIHFYDIHGEIIRINGNQPIDKVSEDIVKALEG